MLLNLLIPTRRTLHHRAKMWDYLKKIYNQNNTARMFQLEHKIIVFQ